MGPELKQMDPNDVKVNVSVRLPLTYRNQLAREAAGRLISLNSLIVDAVMKEVPPSN